MKNIELHKSKLDLKATETSFHGDINDRMNKSVNAQLSMYAGRSFDPQELVQHVAEDQNDYDPSPEELQDSWDEKNIKKAKSVVAGRKKRAFHLAHRLRNGGGYTKIEARRGILEFGPRQAIRLSEARRKTIDDFLHYRDAKKAIADHNATGVQMDFKFLLDIIGDGTIGDLCE